MSTERAPPVSPTEFFRRWFATLAEFYSDPLPIFIEDKEPDNFFSYQSFRIQRFRGLEDVSLDFSKNELMLLLGLNESGKTSILKAIEAFDFSNDPRPDELKRFFTSLRNKQGIESSEPCVITAEISFSEPLTHQLFKKVLKEGQLDVASKPEVEGLLRQLNDTQRVQISRVIPFSSGNPGRSYYQFEGAMPFSNTRLARLLAQEIVRRCPFILYFEDFKDSIPDRIYTSSRSDAFNRSWYEIIDGLFFNTDPSYSVKKFETYYSKTNPREDDARTVLRKVNKTLQRAFTEKWENLSGVQEIEQAEITYSNAAKYFEFKIAERDGTTYSVGERSKGAIWYLAFLMKTEFRRKKLRDGSGKPVYLIDEPASNLHSTAQQKMVEDFFALVEDTSLIYTTHSRYLISPSNVKHTYVVKRNDGVVDCIRFGDYIKGSDSNVSFYQPLYDCLEIVPNNFSIPWDKAIITEGPSDALALELMERVLGQTHDHAIYPGTSANNLSTLISLNLGWGSKFRVMLDSDTDGAENREKYIRDFGLEPGQIILLPGKNTEIEDMFSGDDLNALHQIAFGSPNESVSKKEFLALMRSLTAQPSKHLPKAGRAISAATKSHFKEIFALLKA
jgi:predicted ATP-dependent endonuclease of OLD family